ncbi:MAG: RluA family pseudouridine synthase [Candidatus Woesearchaeota archaeon]|nr:MAG: RluA family pseudouridine synthase [Candidatus Woesearchaeota archaeon]
MQIKITENDAEKRIDRFLRKYLAGAKLGEVYKLIRTEVRVNDKRVKQDYRLKLNDIVDLGEISKELVEKPKEKNVDRITFKILYEDPYYLIVDKPPFLASHEGTDNKNNTLVNQILFYLKERSLSFRPALANRLDKETSGIVIVGKTAEALRLINKELHEKRIKKNYLALVKGNVSKKGKVESYIYRERLHGQIKARVYEKKVKDSKKAVTYYKPVKNFGSYTLLELELDTGRTHQIRVHLSHIGYPVLGDEVYGDNELNKKLKKLGLKRQFLHAYKVVFTHPFTKQRIEIEDDLPEDLRKVLKLLEEKPIVITKKL